PPPRRAPSDPARTSGAGRGARSPRGDPGRPARTRRRRGPLPTRAAAPLPGPRPRTVRRAARCGCAPRAARRRSRRRTRAPGAGAPWPAPCRRRARAPTPRSPAGAAASASGSARAEAAAAAAAFRRTLPRGRRGGRRRRAPVGGARSSRHVDLVFEQQRALAVVVGGQRREPVPQARARALRSVGHGHGRRPRRSGGELGVLARLVAVRLTEPVHPLPSARRAVLAHERDLDVDGAVPLLGGEVVARAVVLE